MFSKQRLVFLQALAVFAMPLALFAGETGKLAGRVVDKKTGEPLPGANVVLEGTTMGAATDVAGEYFIINVPPGTYTVRVSFLGYHPEARSEVRVWIDKTTRLDFALEEGVLEGQEVRVVAYRSDKVEPDLTATKLNYDINDLESLPGITDIGDVIGLQADVDGGHFRGGRSGEELYLVNGASIVNPLDNSRSFEPITLGLEQVEVYTSGFSAEYGNVQSGVINMVAKEGSKDKWHTRLGISTTNSYLQNVWRQYLCHRLCAILRPAQQHRGVGVWHRPDFGRHSVVTFWIGFRPLFAGSARGVSATAHQPRGFVAHGGADSHLVVAVRARRRPGL